MIVGIQIFFSSFLLSILGLLAISATALFDLARTAGGREGALDGFLSWVGSQRIALYPAQEEAVLEVFSGSHVIVNTPTGSGKSLVALGAHYSALAAGVWN